MKYPRTFHLPWSPGGTSDDKIVPSVQPWLNRELIISEKLDGSNSCLNPQGVYARTHAQLATHVSFSWLKARWSTLQMRLRPREEIFGENCLAVHTLVYDLLPDSFFVFGIRQENTWASFDEVEQRCTELGLITPPVLFRGQVTSAAELEKLTLKLMQQPSCYGGPKEGVVIRLAQSFPDADFDKSVVKFVRKNHVQTDDHWMHQPMVKQKIAK